jgi:hypothetical protein
LRIWPEIHERSESDFTADIHAYGILLVVTLTDSDAFDAASVNFARRVTGGERSTIPPRIADGYQALMDRCWDGSPEERPTFLQIAHAMGSAGFAVGGIDAGLLGQY